MRRRRFLAAGAYVLLGLLIGSVGLDRLSGRGRSTNDWQQFDRQQFLVAKVVDGDTIRIASHEGETKVRLIGVDAPEMNYTERKPPAHFAEQATRYLLGRCEGRTVTIRLDQTQTRDRYGRLLAYIYITDAEMLNLALVRDGLAYADRRFKHTYRPQFEMAENDARRRNRGLWRDVRVDQMPAWRQEWLRDIRPLR